MSAYSEAVRDVLRHRIEAADADGFSLLRRVPSTTAWRSVGYIESLPQPEREEIIATCVSIAHETMMQVPGFEKPPQIASPQEAAQRPQAVLFQKIFSQPQLEASPDRFLRQFPESLLQEMVSEERCRRIMDLPVPVTAKAGAIRKEFRRHLSETFGAQAENLGGGEWAYVGRIDALQFHLSIDYGVMGSGFRYGVGFHNPASSTAVRGGGTLETSYGLPGGNCDFPVADELPQLAETFSEIIRDLADLHAAIDRATGGAEGG